MNLEYKKKFVVRDRPDNKKWLQMQTVYLLLLGVVNEKEGRLQFEHGILFLEL